MNSIRYTDSLDSLTAGHLRGGFFAGWPTPPSPETHLRILHGSSAVVLAVDDQTGNIVGYITAISDGVMAAFIPSLEVLAEYRGQGIGSELVRRMLDKLGHLYAIDLLCDPDVQPFYERLGLRRMVGMAMRHYHRQSGS